MNLFLIARLQHLLALALRLLEVITQANLLKGQRQGPVGAVDGEAHRVIESRSAQFKYRFADNFRPHRARFIVVFHRNDIDVRHILDGRQQIGIEVFRFHHAVLGVEILQHAVADHPLQYAAVDLAAKTNRVNDFTDIVGGDDVIDGDFAGAHIHRHVGQLAAVHPGEIGAAAALLFIPVNIRRHVPAVGGEVCPGSPGHIAHLLEAEAQLRAVAVEHLAILPGDIVDALRFQRFPDGVRHALFNFVRRAQNRLSAHQGTARSDR